MNQKMSGKFNGFTQDDINKLSSKTKKPVLAARGIRRVIEKKPASSIDQPRREPPKMVSFHDICDNSMTSTSLQEALHFKPLSAKSNNAPINLPQDEPADESILHVGNNKDVQELESPFKGISLKDFESQRRMIQEQNKQKKELLHKAIEHHSQKTAAEIRKIQEIKAELMKLDSELANDVAMLRKQIETATLQYSNIQKNYQRIESQFLKAKLELYQASEKKELLTEHLCTVIAHNEDRKATKLSELMDKVGLAGNGELEVIENNDCSAE